MSEATGNADRWQLLPRLSDDEYEALKRDVAAQGVLVPVVIDADSGEVIEGHHRVRAWTELRAEGVKVADYPKQLQRFDSDDDRVAFVLAATSSGGTSADSNGRRSWQGCATRAGACGASPKRSASALDRREDIGRCPEPDTCRPEPAVVTGRDDKTYPARRARPGHLRPVETGTHGERPMLSGRSTPGPAGLIGLSRAEERARMANLARARADAAEGPTRILFVSRGFLDDLLSALKRATLSVIGAAA